MSDFSEEEAAKKKKKKKTCLSTASMEDKSLGGSGDRQSSPHGLGGCEGTDSDGQNQQNLQRLSGASVGEPLNLAVLMTMITNQAATKEKRRMAAVTSQPRMMLCTVLNSQGLWELFKVEFKLGVAGFPNSSIDKESACNAGDPSLIPGLGRSSGEGIGYPLQYSWASLVAQLVKNPPAVQETLVRSLGWEDPLEKGMATHSSILA